MNPDATYNEDMDGEDDVRASQRQVVRSDEAGMRKRVTVAENQAQQQASQNGQIDTSTFFLMLAVAALFDLFSLIPGGGFIVTPLATITFYFWFKKHGVKYDRASRWIISIGTPIVELIPFIDIFPTWMLEISFFYLSIKAEQNSK
ncbi:MAG: hypothetical protein RL094_127 [Candidatus Parcubacteria bacterium]|jgi:hypothetical protein